MMFLYSCSTKFSPMEKLEVLKTTFEKINEVGFVCTNFVYGYIEYRALKTVLKISLFASLGSQFILARREEASLS